MFRFLIAAILIALATVSNAGVVAYTWEENGDLKSSWSGTLDLTGLSLYEEVTGKREHTFLKSSRSYFFNLGSEYNSYRKADTNVRYLGSFKTGFQGTFEGDAFGYLTDRGIVYVASDYVNGSALSGTSVIKGQTLSSVGIPAQTFQMTWSTDSITHYFGLKAPTPPLVTQTTFTGAPSPVPLPAGLPMMAAAIGTFAWLRRKS